MDIPCQIQGMRRFLNRLPVDHVVKPRKGHDRLPTKYAYDRLTFGNSDLGDIGIEHAIETLEESDVFAGNQLRDWHHRIGLVTETMAELEREAWHRLEQENEEARVANVPIEEQIHDLQAKKLLLRETAHAKTEALDKDLSEKEQLASDHVSLLGGEYVVGADPKVCLPILLDMSDEAIAAETGKPLAKVDEKLLLSPKTSMFITAVIGAFEGVSYLSLTNALHMDTLFTHPDPKTLIPALAVGLAVSIPTGAASRYAWYYASELFHRTGVRRFTLPSALVLGFCAMDACLAQQGLLKLAALHQAVASLSRGTTGSSTPGITALIAGFFLLVAYVAYNAYAGYTAGRNPAHNHIARFRLARLEAHDREVRASADYHPASKALGDVRIVLAKQGRIHTRCEALCAVLDKEIERLTARLSPIQTELPEHVKHFLQQQRDEQIGGQREFDALYTGTKSTSGGGAKPSLNPGFWSQVGERMGFGPRQRWVR